MMQSVVHPAAAVAITASAASTPTPTPTPTPSSEISPSPPSSSSLGYPSSSFRRRIPSILLILMAGSLCFMYFNLNSRINSLSSSLLDDYLETTRNETNITEELTDIEIENEKVKSNESLVTTLLSEQVEELQQLVDKQGEEIEKLHDIIDFQLNTTVKQLNATVEQVQQNVDEQVAIVNDNVSSQNSLMAYQFAGTFAILGSLISFWHMSAHFRKLHEPTVQRKIIAIMWMIPIYSVSSWLGLVFVRAQAYLSIFKDLYEAYAIYTFLSFLIAILGRGDREAVITVLARHETGHDIDHDQNQDHNHDNGLDHAEQGNDNDGDKNNHGRRRGNSHQLRPPLRLQFWKRTPPTYRTPRHKAEAVLDQCQFFTLQFVLLRPITTIIIVIADTFHESRWDPKYPQFYVTMVVNVSIFFAFTGLVRFYHVVKEDLNWCNPFSKFLCIKGVVFMTFWQGIVISFIAHAVYNKGNSANAMIDTDGINGNYDYDDSSSTEWSKQAQSFLVCLEMFVFAIVHCFVFPTEEWEPGYQEQKKRSIKANFGDQLALRDFVRDVKLVMRSRKTRRGREKLPQRDYDDSSNGGGGGGGGMNMIGEADNSIDIDWSHGWSRIEQYLEVIGTEEEPEREFQGSGNDGSAHRGGMIEMQSRDIHGAHQELHGRTQDRNANAGTNANAYNDLALTVEEGVSRSEGAISIADVSASASASKNTKMAPSHVNHDHEKNEKDAHDDDSTELPEVV